MNLKALCNPFHKPAPGQMAQDELIEAQRSLLQHESASEYHVHMVAYYKKKIERLFTALQNDEF